MGTAVIDGILPLAPTDSSSRTFDISAMAFGTLRELGVLFAAASISDIPLSAHDYWD